MDSNVKSLRKKKIIILIGGILNAIILVDFIINNGHGILFIIGMILVLIGFILNIIDYLKFKHGKV